MARYTITPWQYHSDLLSVRQQLYRLSTPDKPNPPDERRYAVDRVLAWKMRGGNLPHAVESTALIVDAILHHETSQHQQQQSERDALRTAPEISTFSIRAVYTAALTRFITGFCDIGRARAARSNTSSSNSTSSLLPPASMLEIAKQINMPTHFVALRHEATHEEMPALGRLVRISDEGLEWLWGSYWSALVDESSGGEEAVVIEKAEVGRLLRVYRAARRDEFKQGKKKRRVTGGGGDDGGAGVKGASVHVLEIFGNRGLKVIGTAGTAEDAFAEVLIAERLVLPSDRKFGTSLDGAFLFWDDILIALSSSRRSFLQSLLRALFIAMTSIPTTPEIDNDPEREAQFLWILHIITSSAWQEARSKLRSDVRGFVLKQCCLHPGVWSLKLGEIVLDDVEIDDGSRDLWAPLLEASRLYPSGEEQVGKDSPAPGHGDGDQPRPIASDTVDTSMTDAGQPDVDADEPFTGWRRAVFTPKVPIGVVT
ncbi:Las1-domain-containing protein [Polychaeton citri CBS 116435]|uniref:Las1-domain-containing protein n=1 Tax=Polychaeton citri CBS 116435 TaxID=1314669 RepID=A0A9P4QF30_9PEZI|nr:Las1-domain-containing protein [Polychaeton citri CBS 116435]